MRTCSTTACDNPLGKKNTTGLCNVCRLAAYRADPVMEAKRKAGTARAMRDPAHRAKVAERMRKIGLAVPMEVRIASGKAAYQRYLNTPEARAKNRESVTKANKARAEARLFWCDPKYRADYRKMVQRQNIKAADAKVMILGWMADDKRKARNAKPKPFAEKLALVEQGKASIGPALVRHHLTPRVAV